MVKIKDFVIDSTGVDYVDANTITLLHKGNFVEFKNILEDDVFFNYDKHVRKYEKGWGGAGEDKKYDKHEDRSFTLAPAETKKIMNEEHGWKKETHSKDPLRGDVDIRRDIDIKISISGIGEKGEGEYDKSIEYGKGSYWKNWWRNYGWIVIGVGGILLIIIILWILNNKFGIFKKAKGKLKVKGVLKK